MMTVAQKFQLFLLGVPEMVWQEQPFTLPRRQARALLYYLADELQPVPRDRLSFLLWPDTPETTARRNLTRLLSYLRNTLPHPNLLVTTKTAVTLNPDLVESDIGQFAERCAANEARAWETAVPLYRSRFLDGFTLSDSPEFDQWLSQAQRQYERTYLDLLQKLVAARADDRDPASAILYAQKYLATDDLAEAIHRQLISLYAASGDRSAALRQFEQCAMVLERELGVPPLPETRAAYKAARDGTQPASPDRLPKPEWTTLPGLDLPLIGRDEAWNALTEAYRRYRSGGIIFISGEPGVGKSRLMQEFATAQSGLVLTGNSHATGQVLPYQPLVQALRLALPLRDRWTNTLPIWLAEVSRLLPELRTHFPTLPPPMEVAPQQAQARLFEALTEVFGSLATNSPLLLCLDDVHWADEVTLGWLDYVTQRLADRGVCILATYRTQEAERLAEWQRALGRAGLSANIRLTGLTETAVTDLLRKAGVDRTTSASLADRIHTATGGNAFFVLETIRELLETGNISDDAADLPLPQTVRDAVLRRTARLTPLAQQVVAVAAVLSPHVQVETLVETSGRGELETVDSLEELLTHQLLQANGNDFRFQHDLARQSIYEDISPWRRRLLHKRAAEGLERLYQTTLAAFYPSLAYHWSQVVTNELLTDTALVSKAVDYLHKAGDQAVQSSANQEAIDYLNEAIVLVKTLPDTIERNQQELNLQVALYAPLGVAKGWGSPEIATAFNRARELCERIGDPGQLFFVLYGLWGYNITRSNLQTSLELAEQCLTLAQGVDDPALLMEAHRLIDETLFFRGEFVRAWEHLRRGHELYDPQRHHTHAAIYGQDPGVAFLSYGSWILWLQGYPDQARKMSQEAVALAQSLSHLGSQAYALTWAAVFHYIEHEVEATLERAEAAITLSSEQGFALFLAVVIPLRGWALAEQGQFEEGIAQINQGLEAIRATGADARMKVFGLAARAYGKVGQIQQGLTVLDEALDIVNRHGERWWEAELYRLKGELLATQGKHDAQIEANFHRAIAIARKQSAKSMELRATVSLARWWQSQGREAEAYQMLSEIYSWFTEGFDTVYMQEAKALFEELS